MAGAATVVRARALPYPGVRMTGERGPSLSDTRAHDRRGDAGGSGPGTSVTCMSSLALVFCVLYSDANEMAQPSVQGSPVCFFLCLLRLRYCLDHDGRSDRHGHGAPTRHLSLQKMFFCKGTFFFEFLKCSLIFFIGVRFTNI